jgi:hypothetical protein
MNFGSEWVAGADVYVSVFSKYCPIGSGPWGPATPDNATTGFNERAFKVIGITSSSHTSTTNMVGDGNGACNTARVVGSFIINPGSATGINLTRLRIRNTGTSQEGTDIANGGFSVYHEAVTGTEVFDGTETDGGQLWGDWGGDPSNNNFFENAALNIPITGATRVYILLCDLVTGFTPNQTVNLNIVNDGLSFAPLLNTFFGLMRIDETDITNKVVILPHRITHFSGKIMNDHNLLSLSVVNIKENETILLQRSVNNNNWNSIHTFNTIMQDNLNATFRDVEQFKQQVYYRALIINRVNGKKEYSDILRLERNNNKSGFKIYQEATTKAIYLESFGYTGNLQLQLIDVNGRLLGTDQILSVSSGQKQLLMLPSPSSTGLYFLKAVLQDGTQQVLKIVR